MADPLALTSGISDWLMLLHCQRCNRQNALLGCLLSHVIHNKGYENYQNLLCNLVGTATNAPYVCPMNLGRPLFIDGKLQLFKNCATVMTYRNSSTLSLDTSCNTRTRRTFTRLKDELRWHTWPFLLVVLITTTSRSFAYTSNKYRVMWVP